MHEWERVQVCFSENLVTCSQCTVEYAKSIISYAGDPTVFGNFPPAPNLAMAVKKVIDEGKHSGYGPPCGMYT